MLSTGEQIAVALVMARADLLPQGFGSISQAEGYIDPDWLDAVRPCARRGWRVRPWTYNLLAARRRAFGGPGSKGTETPIQLLSGRQDGLSAANGLPLLLQRPSAEPPYPGHWKDCAARAMAVVFDAQSRGPHHLAQFPFRNLEGIMPRRSEVVSIRTAEVMPVVAPAPSPSRRARA